MTRLCPNCGQENDIEREICEFCGNTIIVEEIIKYLSQGKILDKRYEIVCLIKFGGMGAVYKARDIRLDDICAVKEMSRFYSSSVNRKEAIRRFNEEAKILTKLRHQSLPRLRDYFIEDNKYYLVMDFIEGQDLETIWNQTYCKKFDEKEVIEWALQILKVLEYLHGQSPPIIY